MIQCEGVQMPSEMLFRMSHSINQSLQIRQSPKIDANEYEFVSNTTLIIIIYIIIITGTWFILLRSTYSNGNNLNELTD